MANIKSKLRFSIIIPLEFHRGQIEICLERWVHQQTYPRDQYEIVAIGCSSSLDEETVTFFKRLLSEQDRLILFDEPHDMALCAYGARQAKGEVLFFTESHVIPESNLLSVVDQALSAHPEWAGFSCQSIRITPNRLSVVEADMYEADILYGMKEHPWRKILDQCFAVYAENYHHVGGFRPELGHFAEWYLAAQMHQKGYQIGYVPEAQVHHYYTGDVEELIEFSKDFAHGEMKYHAEFVDDECRSYFVEPLEWLIHHQWHPNLIPMALNLAYHAHSKTIVRQLNPREIFARLKLIFSLSFPPATFTKLSFTYARFRFQFTCLLLTLLSRLWLGKSFLLNTFLQFIIATVRFERMRFIQNRTTKQLQGISSSVKFVSSLTWLPDALPPHPFFGFHASEEWQAQKFRWSEPVAILEIPLSSGHYDLKIEWLPVRSIKNLILYINGKPISGFHEDTTQTISFNVTSTSPTYFALTCEPLIAPRDKRILGLPVTSISITPQ